MQVTLFLPEREKAGRSGGSASVFAMVAYYSEYSSKNEGGTCEPSSAAFASQKIPD